MFMFFLYFCFANVRKAWRLADIEYPEDKYRDYDAYLFGGRVDMAWRETCFCWCFWSLAIPTSDLENSDAILLRAMDESLQVQPRDMYWSVLGMMNNPWFRVAILKEEGALKFEHPTHPTLSIPGWMERVKKEGGDLTNGNWGERLDGEPPKAPEPVQEINMKKEGVNRIISLEELQKHTTAEAPWFVVNGEVYDGNKFLEGHPGGAQSIISAAATDASEEFLAIRKLLSDLLVETVILMSLHRQRNRQGDDARLPYRNTRQGLSGETEERFRAGRINGAA